MQCRWSWVCCQIFKQPPRWAVSIIGLTIITGSDNGKQKQSQEANNNLLTENTNKSVLQTITNSTDKVMTTRLTDSSVVSLEPGSILQYYKPFEKNKRQIYLSGIAFFKVAKNKAKPFIVTASGFNTIALGTSFRITAVKQSHTMLVQLFTGKVVVYKSDDKNNLFKNVYLEPSQTMEVNTHTLVSFVTDANKHASAKPKAKISSTVIPVNGLTFSQTLLPEVFIALERRFNVTIFYTQKDVANMNFTGKFNVTENPESILNNIALLNSLKVSKTEAGYKIER